MRTLQSGIRVSDPLASIAFYRALGYVVVGTVSATSEGDLTLLKLPDDEFAALELVDDSRSKPLRIGNGFSHLAIQVESLDQVRTSLATAGFSTSETQRPGGQAGPQTAWATDPDGNRVELTQWPAGHGAGLSSADFEA